MKFLLLTLFTFFALTGAWDHSQYLGVIILCAVLLGLLLLYKSLTQEDDDE